jgi:hypothetical protein
MNHIQKMLKIPVTGRTAIMTDDVMDVPMWFIRFRLQLSVNQIIGPVFFEETNSIHSAEVISTSFSRNEPKRACRAINFN